MNTTDKQQLRHNISEKRHALPASLQQKAAEQICQRLLTIPTLQHAQCIAVYYATHGEANPFGIVSLLKNKTWLLPVVHNKTSMEFFPFTPDDQLTKNKYGILEPRKTQAIAPEKIDAILLPLISFDKNGNRVGRGAGHYDRALSFMQKKTLKKPYLIGIGYEFQKSNPLTPNTWDIPLALIITEENTYNPREPL